MALIPVNVTPPAAGSYNSIPEIINSDNNQVETAYSNEGRNYEAISKNQAAELANLGPPTKSTPASSTQDSDSSDATMGFKVTLTAQPSYGRSSLNKIVFDVMPVIQESRAATYKSFQPTQHPGEILKYETTSSRTWGINVKLISRTAEEATDNLRKINILRSWVMPFYGEGTANSGAKEYLGAPPPIITLNAYGPKTIGPAKCIVENYNWTWPIDVDYVNTIDGTPFPVMIDISLQLKETWSPAEYSNFNIISYRQGLLSDAFGGSPSSDQNNTAPYSNEGRNYTNIDVSSAATIDPTNSSVGGHGALPPSLKAGATGKTASLINGAKASVKQTTQNITAADNKFDALGNSTGL